MLRVVKNQGIGSRRKVLVVTPALERADHARLRRMVRGLPAEGWKPLVLSVPTPLFSPSLAESNLGPDVERLPFTFGVTNPEEAGQRTCSRLSESWSSTLAKFVSNPKKWNVFNHIHPSKAWPFLVPKAVRACKDALEMHPDTALLFVSGFSRTAATIGYLAHSLTKLPLFLDFSPAWFGDDAIGGKDFSIFGKAEHALDRHILRATEKILFNSRHARETYGERFPNLPPERFGVVYDPFGSSSVELGTRARDSKFTLVLGGSFSCEEKTRILKGLRRFLAKEYVPSKRIRLVLLDEPTGETMTLARDMGLELSMRVLSCAETVSRRAWMDQAHAVLLGSDGHEPFLPPDWSDALASGSFLIDLTKNRELQWLVRQSRSGVSLSPHSVEEIAVGISQAWNLDRARFEAERDGHFIDNFSVQETARRLSAILDETLLRNTRKSGRNSNKAGLRTVL